VVSVTWSQFPAQLLELEETLHMCNAELLLRLTAIFNFLVEMTSLLLYFLLLPLQEHCSILKINYVVLELLLVWRHQLLLLSLWCSHL
jgi:hypothetical protein